jgi:hypothetical protein
MDEVTHKPTGGPPTSSIACSFHALHAKKTYEVKQGELFPSSASNCKEPWIAACTSLHDDYSLLCNKADGWTRDLWTVMTRGVNVGEAVINTWVDWKLVTAAVVLSFLNLKQCFLVWSVRKEISEPAHQKKRGGDITRFFWWGGTYVTR